VPMFGEHPIELGLQKDDGFLTMLRLNPTYGSLFTQAFAGESDPFTIANVVKAIACFERSIISARSPYDRYHYGADENAISDAAKRGEMIFFSQPAACFQCHGGFAFGGGFHEDAGNLKAPTLRNIALTAPYMHDGKVASLEDTLEHNAHGSYQLSADQRKDLLAFLKSLTDDELLRDPRFADPWHGKR